MSTILVTGGAGFIGSHLCTSLLAKKHTVICVDNFNDYYDPKYKKQNIKKAKKSNSFILKQTDITNLLQLEKVFTKQPIDIVVHLAARAGVRPSIENPIIYEETNVRGTYNVLSLSQKYDVKKLVFASSSSVYGQNAVPFSENMALHSPLSPYAATKIAAESACYVWSTIHRLPITILRFFSVYGPNGRPDMAPYLFTDAIVHGKPITQIGDGSSARDWTYVHDIVEAIILAMDLKTRFEIINLGNSAPIKLSTMIKTIEKITGHKAIINQVERSTGEVQTTWATIDHAKDILHWSPKTSFETGMKNFITWFTENRI